MRRKHELVLVIQRGTVGEEVAVHVLARLYCTGPVVGLSGSLELALLSSDACQRATKSIFRRGLVRMPGHDVSAGAQSQEARARRKARQAGRRGSGLNASGADRSEPG